MAVWNIIVVPGPPPAKSFIDSFTGYIDEVRISKVARYDVEKKGFMPDGKFKDDAKTVALWHFDAPSGTQEFLDASRNLRPKDFVLGGFGNIIVVPGRAKSFIDSFTGLMRFVSQRWLVAMEKKGFMKVQR